MEVKTQSDVPSPVVVDVTHDAARLSPSDLFALKHPDSPGIVVKESFLGRQSALAVRDALTELATSGTFHEAKVGAGQSLRNDRTVRGDKIHWIQTPNGLNAPTESVDPAILHLRRQVESLVYGLKKVSPKLDLRNVVSTQFAVFPGDGARFVKHVDTYLNAHRNEQEGVSKDGLVRLITCVYYLNDRWEPEHGGHLRVHLKDSKLLPAYHWDVPPNLDTLLVFRSLDVEHEVMPTYRERKAVTIWYYGKQSQAAPASRTETSSVPRPLPSITGSNSDHAEQASVFVAIPSYRDSECRHTVDNLLAQATFPKRISIGICLQTDDEDDTQAYLESKYSTSQVRVHWVDYREAAGPCVARRQAQKLYQGHFRRCSGLPALHFRRQQSSRKCRMMKLYASCSSEKNLQWLHGCGLRVGTFSLLQKLWCITFGLEPIVLFSKSWKVMRPSGIELPPLTTSSSCCELTRRQ
ncbi:uncharacterized protein PITG_00576 [Phytophthora infestans T30-4]|uniref:Fe2OG dioxygenase domain-containing protein n=1 Tax=Phytophthora infestans (strain T30-4) TaxID=403677 RepID=D0MR58_PHYIT|nr:uncharacterized protein PITG_00576 [Phytophthora infestans T30-4]EEY57977.1 conserved hypothetical protein [Phytophthora infestans T30-4]|eukprot:XP_002909163.1 conserved hypothetical protein [Phytophthora infestans T30-4]